MMTSMNMRVKTMDLKKQIFDQVVHVGLFGLSCFSMDHNNQITFIFTMWKAKPKHLRKIKWVHLKILLCSFLRGLMFICEMPKRTRGLGMLFLRFFNYDDPPIN